ncbi:hypothetical protein E2C01_029870 [Portunus trituberculatus]|uniref:Uncharacterized protein n=1 Tax=Portunus trituberculatus TaxID=210409 RepID=A0A5B7EU36_PORTR|nr:hypothetical protein [Portunus trituberculatus]
MGEGHLRPLSKIGVHVMAVCCEKLKPTHTTTFGSICSVIRLSVRVFNCMYEQEKRHQQQRHHHHHHHHHHQHHHYHHHLHYNIPAAEPDAAGGSVTGGTVTDADGCLLTGAPPPTRGVSLRVPSVFRVREARSRIKLTHILHWHVSSRAYIVFMAVFMTLLLVRLLLGQGGKGGES